MYNGADMYGSIISINNMSNRYSDMMDMCNVTNSRLDEQ